MVTSIVICKHGNLGYTASLRFDDSRTDVDISATSKYDIYKKIDNLVYADHHKDVGYVQS